MCDMAVKHYCKCMNKLNLIAVASIVAAVSLVVGMASPIAAFAQDNMTMNMDDNMSSMGNMTSGNATSMTETESLPSANETGVCQPCCIGPHPSCYGNVRNIFNCLFSDRPDRIVGSANTTDFIGNWSWGPNNFTVDPPNAVLILDDEIEGEQRQDYAITKIIKF